MKEQAITAIWQEAPWINLKYKTIQKKEKKNNDQSWFILQKFEKNKLWKTEINNHWFTDSWLGTGQIKSFGVKHDNERSFNPGIVV